MPAKLYRDQVERFYELERLEYSRTDIASLCAMALGMVSRWRKEPPNATDYRPRPDHLPGLPPMRAPKKASPNADKPIARATPPAGPPGQEDRPGEPSTPGPLHETLGNPQPTPQTGHRDTPPGRIPGFVLTEKYGPGGKAERAKQGALRPVTQGQLTGAVSRELKKQRAELLAEIKAQGFDPVTTWTTQVDHVAFDPIKALVQLAHVPGCPEHTVLGILRTLVTLRKERAKIAWEGVKLEDIPQEFRQRLAGLLAESMEVADLPAEVVEHPAVREVYELTGVALPEVEEAEAFLLRWEPTLEEMREDAQAHVVDEEAEGRLVMTAPPAKAAEFRVRPATGNRPR